MVSFFSCKYDHVYPDYPESSLPVMLKQLYIQGNDTLRYQILPPENIEPGKKYPLLLFCHGSFQRGNDNEAQIQDFPKVMLSHFGRNMYPCYILAPQVPENQLWVNVSYAAPSEIMPATISNVEMLTINLIDRLELNNPIDTNRIYVTGVSIGGFGTWDLISRYPQKFAAAVPIAGGGDENEAPLLTHVPIWAFHGALDNLVMPSRSINMVNAVNNAGGNARLTLYSDQDHACWKKAYVDPELFKWMFSKMR
jgi:predicted peptidase